MKDNIKRTDASTNNSGSSSQGPRKEKHLEVQSQVSSSRGHLSPIDTSRRPTYIAEEIESTADVADLLAFGVHSKDVEGHHPTGSRVDLGHTGSRQGFLDQMRHQYQTRRESHSDDEFDIAEKAISGYQGILELGSHSNAPHSHKHKDARKSTQTSANTQTIKYNYSELDQQRNSKLMMKVAVKGSAHSEAIDGKSSTWRKLTDRHRSLPTLDLPIENSPKQNDKIDEGISKYGRGVENSYGVSGRHGQSPFAVTQDRAVNRTSTIPNASNKVPHIEQQNRMSRDSTSSMRHSTEGIRKRHTHPEISSIPTKTDTPLILSSTDTATPNVSALRRALWRAEVLKQSDKEILDMTANESTKGKVKQMLFYCVAFPIILLLVWLGIFGLDIAVDTAFPVSSSVTSSTPSTLALINDDTSPILRRSAITVLGDSLNSPISSALSLGAASLKALRQRSISITALTTRQSNRPMRFSDLFLAIFDVTDDQLRASMGTTARILANIFSGLISVTGFVLQMSVTRFGPQVRTLFFRSRTAATILCWVCASLVYSVLTQYSISRQYLLPRLAGLIVLVMTFVSLLSVYPYFVFLFEFLDPARIVNYTRKKGIEAVEAESIYALDEFQQDQRRKQIWQVESTAVHSQQQHYHTTASHLTPNDHSKSALSIHSQDKNPEAHRELDQKISGKLNDRTSANHSKHSTSALTKIQARTRRASRKYKDRLLYGLSEEEARLKRLDHHQLRCNKSMDVLTEIARVALSRKEKNVAHTVLKALFMFVNRFSQHKAMLPDEWFSVPIWMRQTADFVGLPNDAVVKLKHQRCWFEYKILKKHLSIYCEALSSFKDIANISVTNTRVIAINAVLHKDLAVVDLCIKYFNTYLKLAIDAKDSTIAASVLHQYRIVVEYFFATSYRLFKSTLPKEHSDVLLSNAYSSSVAILETVATVDNNSNVPITTGLDLTYKLQGESQSGLDDQRPNTSKGMSVSHQSSSQPILHSMATTGEIDMREIDKPSDDSALVNVTHFEGEERSSMSSHSGTILTTASSTTTSLPTLNVVASFEQRNSLIDMAERAYPEARLLQAVKEDEKEAILEESNLATHARRDTPETARRSEGNSAIAETLAPKLDDAEKTHQGDPHPNQEEASLESIEWFIKELSKRALLMARYSMQYFHVCLDNRLSSIAECIMAQLTTLCESAFTLYSPCHSELLALILYPDQHAAAPTSVLAGTPRASSSSAFASVPLGVLMAQVKLATTYIVLGAIPCAQQIHRSMRKVPVDTMKMVGWRLENINDTEIWEISDFNANTNFLPETQKAALATFISWSSDASVTDEAYQAEELGVHKQTFRRFSAIHG